jgi:uncharacterized membrane protein (UPF0127 family)
MSLGSRIKAAVGDGEGAARKREPDARLQLVNRTRDSVLATSLEVADTAEKRNKGLLGRKELASGGGLWIIPCESVHTFFMQFAIDLIYLDRQKRIRKLRHAVPAWRMSACLSAHSVIELPAGTILNSRTEPGDTLEFLPVAATEE